MSITKEVLALSRRMRQDMIARKTVQGVLAHEDCDTLADLAKANPQAISMLVEMFDEMDADDEAIDGWTKAWKPANLRHLEPPL